MAYVDASAAGANDGSTWADAYTDLQAALAAARSGGGVTEIWVRAGTYKPAPAGGDQALSFELAPGVGLYGGFAGGETQREQAEPGVNLTVLSGDLLGDDLSGFTNMGENSRHVVVMNTAGGTFALEGFTITGGASDTNGGGINVQQGTAVIAVCQVVGNSAAQRGGGLYVHLRGTRVQHCRFERNQAGTRGGGAFVQGAPGNEVTSCEFVNNHGLGGGGGLAGTALIDDCDFIANRASGGIWADGGGFYSPAATVRDSRFEGNLAEEGGGIYFEDRSTAIGCSFSGNEGGGASCFLLRGTGTLTNSLFAGNAGSECRLREFGRITNCTFVGNGVHLSEPSRISNCISWGPGVQAGIWLERGAKAAYCTTRGPARGMGNTTADPKFAHHHAGVWAESPLYDAARCQVTLTADDADWAPDALRGRYTRPDLARGLQFRIISNTASTLTIHADRATVEAGASWIAAGAAFEIFDYRLGPDSPCIDSGHNEVATSETYDFDGQPRFVDSPGQPDSGVGPAPIVDRGAFEFAGPRIVLSHLTAAVPENEQFVLEVRLSDNPGGPVTLVVQTSGDVDMTVAPSAPLMFDSTQFDQPQPLTIRAAPDVDFLNGRMVVRFEWPGGPVAEFVAVEADDEPAPGRVYVDQSATGDATGADWANAFPELRDALQALADRGAVADFWIAQGSYLPAIGVFERTFRVGPNVGLYGGFAGGETDISQADPGLNVTELSGDLLGDDVRYEWATRADNSIHVVTLDHPEGSLETTTLDGLTIAGGHAAEETENPGIGGGVFGEGGQLEVRRCVFRDNFAEQGGGIGTSGSALLIDCRFEWNAANLGAGVAVEGDDVDVRGCIFRLNSVNWGGGVFAISRNCRITGSQFTNNEGVVGGGAAILSDQATISDCRFEANSSGNGALALLGESAKLADVALVSNVSTDWGGAIFCGGAVTMERMRIVGNRGANGAAVYTGGSLLIRNALIADNDALGYGGAIYAEDDSPRTFINCTIVNNRAAQATGGGFYSTAGDAEFVNCILWGNADKQGSGEAAQLRTAGGTLAVSHSTVAQWSGALGGAANQGDDPILLQPAVLKYRLSECSPAVNAGDNAAAIDPNAIDLDGAARVYGGAVDMGAYERVYTDDDGDQMPDGCQCRADVDGNGVVNLDDLLITLGNSGLAPAAQADGDVDADGEVDGQDVKRLLAEFGAMCP